MCYNSQDILKARKVTTNSIGLKLFLFFSPEVHNHLQSFEHVELQVVKTAQDSQLLNLLSVSRLVTILDEADQCGVDCKLQELDRGVFRCAVVGVDGEEQWGDNAVLMSSSTGAGCVFSQPH